MTRETFIEQRIKIDKVTRKYFDKNYIVIECDCGKSYCNGWRCLTKSDINDENLFNYIKKIENEKQQLITWLEDKIKECDKNIDEFFSIYGKATVNNTQIKRKAFQEVLDFVRGGKE